MNAKRREVIKTIAGGAVTVGVLGGTIVSAQTESEVLSEITLPEGDAKGLGAYSTEDSTYFTVGHTASQWYFIETDGSVFTEGTLDDEMDLHGFDYDGEASYVGGYELRKYPGEGEPVTAEMPDYVYSIAIDQAGDRLWVGGGNGNIWRVDPDTLDIEETIDFGESVFGLAYDGEVAEFDSLWIGDAGRSSIVEYNLITDEEVATYEYPNAQQIYDYAFIDDRLWLLGDDTIYGNEIEQLTQTSTETPTPTATETPTATATSTPTATPTATATPEPESQPTLDFDSGGTPTATDTATPTPPSVETTSEEPAPTATESQAATTTTGGSGPGFGWGTTAVGAATLGLWKLFGTEDSEES